MDTARSRLGRNMRRLRLTADLTQENAAVLAGVERAYWSEIERGTRNPSVDVIDRIAGALHVDVMELFRPLPEADLRPPQRGRPRAASTRTG